MKTSLLTLYHDTHTFYHLCISSKLLRNRIYKERAVGKVVENPDLVRINTAIRMYGGTYANWKSGGCKTPIPVDLIDKLSLVEEEVDTYLRKTGRKHD